MRRLYCLLLAAASIAAAPYGDVWQSAYCLDYELRGPTLDYQPQAGDIVLYSYEGSILWGVGYKVALSGGPDHSGIVVCMPDGTFGILEAGPDDSLMVQVMSLSERLRFHACNRGRTWVRRRKCPLTDEQSCRLTQFAISERGKNFSLLRLGAQITPMRSRGPLQTSILGRPQGPHYSYICSEIVIEAAVYAGLINPETSRPRATYPEDIFFDRSRNRYLDQHFNLSCTWEPPARLTFEDCPCCKARKGGPFRPNPEAIPSHPWFQCNGPRKPNYSLRGLLNPG